MDTLFQYDDTHRFLTVANTELFNQNIILKRNIMRLQDRMALDICEYFNSSKSLKDTTYEFCFDCVDDCYQALIEYFGCADPLYKAHDYEEYIMANLVENEKEEEIRKNESGEEGPSEEGPSEESVEEITQDP